jgi:hypothetical protein
MATTPNVQLQPTWAKPQSSDIVERDVRWWEAQNIPWQLVRELRRRKNNVNIGQNAGVNTVTNFQMDHETYRGPMTPWVRAFSNGTGQVGSPTVPISKYLLKNDKLPIYEGFVLSGGEGFNNAYGFKRQGNALVEDKAIIGYQANGNPHFIDTKYRTSTYYDAGAHCPGGLKFPQNSTVPSILPPPGITSINVKTNKDMMSNATINWQCYSLAQLEYMMPFWLSPKINVFLEFGWNLFNIDSLVPLDDVNECYKLILRPELALEKYYKSFGNYGLITGIISKYNFSTEDGFVYNCTTELISRQAMYAGYRADNPTVSQGDNKQEADTKEYVNLKDFFSNYLQFTKQVLESRENYINYLLDPKNTETLRKALSKQAKDEKKQQVQAQQTGLPGNFKPSNNFYSGKKENRVFMGRIQDVYKASKIPKKKTLSRADAATLGGRRNPTPGNPMPAGSRAAAAAAAGQRGTQTSGTPSPAGSRGAAAAAAGLRGNPVPVPVPNTSEVITYAPGESGPTNNGVAYKNVVSFADKSTDFDYEDGSNDEAWYQLDFVFEIINLFCAEPKTGNNNIDISDIIIGGHPNLISCDKDVLIPNPIAPKVNIGRAGPKGYLDQSDVSNNAFLDQYYWENYNSKINAGLKEEKDRAQKLKANSLDAECITTISSPLWKAALKARNTFKTGVAARDNLDTIINWLYYTIGGQGTNSAAFPFSQPKTVGSRTYQAHYYGYLKHIYISKSRLIEIGKDTELKTLEQIVNKILNIINDAVDNFWNLQTVRNENGGLSIIDKNLSLPREYEIYKFDIGSTSNVIKKIDFQVNLTNEQVNSVLYGSGQNAANNTAGQVTDILNNSNLNLIQKKDKITQIKTGLPSLNYADRFDSYQILDEVNKKLKEIDDQIRKERNEPPKQQSDSELNQTVPHGPIVDKNEEIRRIQTQGKQDEKVLVMRVRALLPGEDPYGPIEEKSYKTQILGIDNPFSGEVKTSIAKFGWVMLNLPPTLKGKLREMLDDSDTTNNNSKYSGPADNFTLTLTFDGIFGFRMFQHIAISNLPKPYVPGNVIFMINEVDHQINAGKWETVVTAMLRCCPDQNYKFINV